MAFLGYCEPQVLEVLKYPSIKTVLGSLSNRRSKESGRNGKKNTYKGENRQTTCGSVILYNIYEYMRSEQ